MLRQTPTRIRFHTKRFRGDLIVSTVVIMFYALMISLAFPKDSEAIAAYSEILTESSLDVFFLTLDSSAPAWLFWLSLMLGLVMYYVLAIVGIRIGARLVPTKEEDSLEMLVASSPQSQRRFFVESYLSGLLSIMTLVLISFVIFIGFSLANDAADTIGRLGLVHLFSLLLGVFMMTFSAFASLIRFNKRSGEKFGYFYLVFAFFIELSSAQEDFDEQLLNLSINNYLSPTSGILTNEWEWEAFLVVLGLTITMFVLAWWWIKRPEYYERVKPTKTRHVRFLPNYAAKGPLARRFPVFFDQLRADRSLLYIWTPIIAFFIFYVLYLFGAVYGDDPAKLSEALGSFDIPIFDAFTHGHPLDMENIGYIQFMGFEYYGIFWLYYGLFLLFPSSGAANRDFRNNAQDVVWANEVTPRRVIAARTLAIQFQFFVLFTLTYAFLLVYQGTLGVDVDMELQIYAYVVGIVYFIGLGLLLQGISMLFRVDRGKKYTTWFFLASVLILLTAFIATDINDIKYFSVLYYYDAVGIVWGLVSFGEALMTAAIFTVLSAVVYIIGLTKFSKQNLS